MFNRLLSPLGTDHSNSAPGWDVDRNPQFRLVLLWFVAMLPIIAIAVRAGQLQLSLRERFTEVFETTTESYEEIPVRDGRIFAADGTILADDVECYDVAVDYRAIEDPPNEAWLTREAKDRLSKSESRDKQKLAAAKNKVIAERDAFWQRLADLTGTSIEEIVELRRREQKRVESMKAAVLSYRDEQAKQKAKEAATEKKIRSLEDLWRHLTQNVTEPRQRNRGSTEIREETEHSILITEVDENVKIEIEAHPQKYRFAEANIRRRRIYPQKELAAQLIGIRKPLSAEQHEQRSNQYPDGDPLYYRIGDPFGISGLERSYDELLKGVRGRRVIVRNRGQITETRTTREPRPGRDLTLTLLPDLQQRCEQLLDTALIRVLPKGSLDAESNQGILKETNWPKGGALVAIDVYTGAILAAASAPRCDNNLQINSTSEEWDEISSDPRSPLLSRTTQMALPPGSVFKIVTAIAALESGKVHPQEMISCQGYLDVPSRDRCLIFRHYGLSHGHVNLADALCRSCNVYFFTAARRMGPQTLVDWARKFGIGRPTGIDLPSESSGRLPVPDTTEAAGERRLKWKAGDTLGMAIGQSEVLVTPMQMVRVVAAVANDGQLVIPHLAADLGAATVYESDSISSSIPKFAPESIEGLHEETLNHVREGMVEVVNKLGGTGFKKVRMEEVTIAGKTGTAQSKQHGIDIDHAWFAGYVPAEQPRVAFVIVLENGGGGGSVAGPVAHDFVKALLELSLINKATDLASRRLVR